MGRSRASYIHNLAVQLIGKLGVVYPEKKGRFNPSPQDIHHLYGDRIKQELRKMTRETRGRIADCGLSWSAGLDEGKTSLYEVHCGSYLDKSASGRDLVTQIACTAICAAMWDVFWSRQGRELAAAS